MKEVTIYLNYHLLCINIIIISIISDASHNCKELTQELKLAILKMDEHNQSMFESMSKRVNESIMASRHDIIEECKQDTSKSVTDSSERLRSEVNVCLKAGTQHLIDTVHALEKKFDTLSRRIDSFEDNLASFRDSSFRAESDATHALSLCGDNKRVLTWCDDMLRRLDNEVEVLARRESRRQDGTDGRSHSGDRHPLGSSKRETEHMLAEMRDDISQQAGKISTITKILEDHRADYQEVVSRLSSAGRKAKASQQELFDRLAAIGDIKHAVDRVLNDIVSSSEEDKVAMNMLKEDNAACAGEIDALRSSMVELAQLMPQLSDVKQTIQESLSFYHDTEINKLSDQIMNLEKKLVDVGVLPFDEDFKTPEELGNDDVVVLNEGRNIARSQQADNSLGSSSWHHGEDNIAWNDMRQSQSLPAPPLRNSKSDNITAHSPCRSHSSATKAESDSKTVTSGKKSTNQPYEGFYPSMMTAEEDNISRLPASNGTCTSVQSLRHSHSEVQTGRRGNFPNSQHSRYM